jgi:polar amino acid transport system permease protein
MFLTVTQALLVGFGTAVKIFAFTLLFSLPLGLVVAAGSMSKWAPFWFLSRPGAPAWKKRLAAFRPISAVVNVIVWIIRGTPLMLQLIIIFYVPGMVTGTSVWGSGDSSRVTATIVAFVINYACYFSVIYRGGMEGVPAGQREAGQVLGMTRSQIFFRVTLLQMIKRVVPPMSNEIITLVKDTSLARTIGVVELIRAGEYFRTNGGLIWPFFYTGVFYLVFVGVLTLLFGYIERKLNYFK